MLSGVLLLMRAQSLHGLVPQRFKNWTILQLIPMRTLDKLMAQFFGIKRRKR
jgi:hypothetical protein